MTTADNKFLFTNKFKKSGGKGFIVKYSNESKLAISKLEHGSTELVNVIKCTPDDIFLFVGYFYGYLEIINVQDMSSI